LILRHINNCYSNEQHRSVSSEATYAQLSAIHREVRGYWQEVKRPASPDLSLWLADVTLHAARAALAGKDPGKGNPHIRQIRCILTSAAVAVGEHKVGWFDYADTALHMCERMLGARLAPDANRALALEIDPTRKRGRPCGTYATPRDIAQDVIRDVLRALPRSSTLDLIDLSTEAGQFLVTTVAAVPKRPGVRLFAIDRDQSALRLARKFYTFAHQHSQSQIPLALTCRDSLFDPLPRGWPRMFDAVVGNPPWAARCGSYTGKVRSAYPSLLTQNFDLYLAFMLRADELLRPGGFLAMVVPSTFLFNNSGRQVRRYLLEHYDVLTLRIYPRGSIVEVSCIVPVSFVLRKRVQGSKRHVSTQIIYESSRVDGSPGPSAGTACDAASYWQSLAGVPFHPWVRIPQSPMPGINCVTSVAL
jgi:N-6 DNA Methylase